VTFRGTNTGSQLIIESLQSVVPVLYTLHNIPNALVDQYFQDTYASSLRVDVMRELSKATVKYPDYLFIFTGHSLGAALATIAVHDMVLSGVVPKA